jgi:hypothetical protein
MKQNNGYVGNVLSYYITHLFLLIHIIFYKIFYNIAKKKYTQNPQNRFLKFPTKKSYGIF